ncbi:hypothetical protein GCM10028807_57690 [Spirosoma daeguense]
MPFFSLQTARLIFANIERELGLLRGRIFDKLSTLKTFTGSRNVFFLQNGDVWRYDPDSNATPDDIFAANTAKGSGRLLLDVDRRVNIVKRFGIKLGEVSQAQRIANSAAFLKALQCGRPLWAPEGGYQFDSTLIDIQDVNVDLEGVRFFTRFQFFKRNVDENDNPVEEEQVGDFLKFSTTSPDYQLRLANFVIEAMGQYTNATALQIDWSGQTAEYDNRRARQSAEVTGVDCVGTDALELSPRCGWRHNIVFRNPNNMQFTSCYVQTWSGLQDVGADTYGVEVYSDRAGVDNRARDIRVYVAGTGLKGVSTGFPGLEGFHFTDCYFIGTTDAVIWRADNYAMPGFVLDKCHLTANNKNIQLYGLVQYYITNCYIYNFGGTHPSDLCSMANIVRCSDGTVANNKMYVLRGPHAINGDGSAKQTIYGILMNHNDPTQTVVGNMIHDNYIYMGGGPTATPAIWLQGHTCNNNQIYNNVGIGTAVDHAWEVDSPFNHVGDNTPRDPADSLSYLDLEYIDPNNTALGLQLDASYPPRGKTILVNPTTKVGKVERILLPFGVTRRFIFNQDGIIIKHSTDMWLAGAKDTVTKDRELISFERTFERVEEVNRRGLPGVIAPPVGLTVTSVGAIGSWSDDAATLASITIDATVDYIVEGDTGTTALVTAHFSDGSTQNVTASATKTITTADSGATWGNAGALSAATNATYNDNRNIEIKATYNSLAATKQIAVIDATPPPCEGWAELSQSAYDALPDRYMFEYNNPYVSMGGGRDYTVRSFASAEELKSGLSGDSWFSGFDLMKWSGTGSVSDKLYNGNRLAYLLTNSQYRKPAEGGYWGYNHIKPTGSSLSGSYTLIRTNQCGEIIERSNQTYTQPNVANARIFEGVIATASSSYSALPASKAVQGNKVGRTFWQNNDGTDAVGSWLQVDLGQDRDFNRAIITMVPDNFATRTEPVTPLEISTGFLLTAFRIQVPDDGGGWVTIATVTGNNHCQVELTFEIATAQVVRVLVDGSQDSKARIADIDIRHVIS